MISIFKAMPTDSNGIVFLGTSLTQGFPVQEAFKDITIQNRGIAANTTANILNRLDDIIKSKPRKIFIEGGANDVTKIPTDSIYNNLVKIFGMIKAGTPKTKIYYQSILPFGDGITGSIEELNNKINTYCKVNDIVFINLYPDFLGGTAMKKELTIDGTHLTGKGYSLWINNIRKYVLY
ncbi:MAG: GDSL-type esterase/lipase family protein [Mucilaginibacter sp.]